MFIITTSVPQCQGATANAVRKFKNNEMASLFPENTSMYVQCLNLQTYENSNIQMSAAFTYICMPSQQN